MTSRSSLGYVPLSVVFFGWFLHGCAIPASGSTAYGSTLDACVGGSGGMVQNTFRVNVTDVKWRDEVAPFHMEYLSQRDVATLGQQAKIHPQANFLVADLTITNATNKSAAYNHIGYTKSYTLVTDTGVEYAFLPMPISITNKTGIGQNINPGMSVQGSIVLDVPKNTYKFVIDNDSYSRSGSGTLNIIRARVFHCYLNVS